VPHHWALFSRGKQSQSQNQAVSPWVHSERKIPFDGWKWFFCGWHDLLYAVKNREKTAGKKTGKKSQIFTTLCLFKPSKFNALYT
jgi:hypothetical protein